MLSVLAALLLTARAPPSPAAMAQARTLTERSILEYNAGEFRPALDDATKAYLLSAVPALLFNLAQCQRALGNWKQAEFFFRRYLGEIPHARNRAEVLALIAEVHAKAAATSTAAETATDVHVRVARAASASRGTRLADRGPRLATAVPETPNAHASRARETPLADRGPRLATAVPETPNAHASRARETPLAHAHVSSPAPLAATALPSIASTARPYHTRPWLAYTGAALLAGAGVAGFYSASGYAGAATATGNRERAPPAEAASYGPNISHLQSLGTGALVTGIALAVAGTTLLVLGLIHHP